MKVTLHRFGRNRRLVLILEWLTLWPTWGPLAVSSQRRDIVENPLPSPGLWFRCFGSHTGGLNHVHLGNGGRIGAEQGGVKVLAAPEGGGKAGLAGIFAALSPSYKRR